MLSGRDEEPNRDIPICPLCGERPKYWTLYPRSDGSSAGGWTWLYGMGEAPSRVLNRLAHYYCSEVGVIRSVRCRRHGNYPNFRHRHLFGEETAILEEVLEYARKLENER